MSLAARAARLFLFAAALLTAPGCFTFEGRATSKLEEKGCSTIALTRTGPQSFDYEATCDGRFCSGELDIGSVMHNYAQTCSSKVPADATIEGPGKVVLALGNVTGACDVDEVRSRLEHALPRFKACYDLSLSKFPELEGHIGFDWTIAEDGTTVPWTSKHDMAPVNCGRGVLEEIAWTPPERGTCAVQWTLGWYTDLLPPTERGHDRMPAMEACPNTMTGELPKGQFTFDPATMIDRLDGDWELEALETWTASDDDALHVLADRFEPPSGVQGTVSGRQTLLCHTQALRFETTTAFDDHGEEVTTRRLAGDDAAVHRSHTKLPVQISMDTGRVRWMRRFGVELLNGRFVSTLEDVDAPANADVPAMLDGLPGMRIVAVHRDEDHFDLFFALKKEHFELVARGAYVRR